MKNATIAGFVFGPFASKTVTAADSTSTKIEESTANTSCIGSADQDQDPLQASLAESLFGRKLTPGLAKVEIQSTRLACSAADKTLTAVGNMLVRVGVICLDAGERAAAFGIVCTPGGQVEFSKEAMTAWPEVSRRAMDSKLSARNRAYYVALARIRFERDRDRQQAFDGLNRTSS